MTGVDVIVNVAVFAVMAAVLWVTWRARRSKLAQGVADAGQFYNSVLGVGGGPAPARPDRDARAAPPG